MRAAPRFAPWIALLLLAHVAFANVHVISPLTEEHAWAAGTRGQFPLRVVNASDAPQAILLTVEDIAFEAGEVIPVPAGSILRSAAAWIVLPPSAVPLASREGRDVAIAVNVPDVTPPGTYWARLLVTPIPPLAPAAAAGVGVREIHRVAVNVIVDVPGDAPVRLTLRLPRVERDAAGALVMSVDALNDGDRLLRPTFTARVYDAHTGALAGSADAPVVRLFPGFDRPRSFPLGALPPGSYTVVIVADAGSFGAFGLRFALEVGDP
jgi:hypothetical protein